MEQIQEKFDPQTALNTSKIFLTLKASWHVLSSGNKEKKVRNW